MKITRANWIRLSVGGAVLIGAAPLLVADSNIADPPLDPNPPKFTWGENVGHLNWADANGRTEGVEIYQNGTTQFLRGWIWGENIGWINVGNGGAPYANTDDTDFGVNINTSTGDMTGFAWAENVGWINFGPFPGSTLVQSARWDHANFRSEGYAWGENIGWINLDDAIEFICAIPGDLDFDGDVDVLDFGLFGTSFGSTGNPSFTNGDVDGDGDADVLDFGIFGPNFGSVCP